ncbi:hypothetical protein M514_06043, partial [Trichuris suis]
LQFAQRIIYGPLANGRPRVLVQPLAYKLFWPNEHVQERRRQLFLPSFRFPSLAVFESTTSAMDESIVRCDGPSSSCTTIAISTYRLKWLYNQLTIGQFGRTTVLPSHPTESLYGGRSSRFRILSTRRRRTLFALIGLVALTSRRSERWRTFP